MATFIPVNSFMLDLGSGIHDFNSHTYKLALTNVAPVPTNTVLANLTQIAAGNGYPAGGVTLDNSAISINGNGADIVVDDEVITAAGGAIGTHRYYALYNDTAASDNLVGYFDKGAPVDVLDGETETIDFAAVPFTLNPV